MSCLCSVLVSQSPSLASELAMVVFLELLRLAQYVLLMSLGTLILGM